MKSWFILASYFSSIIALLVLTNNQWRTIRYKKFSILAAISLILTWERMLRYFVWSFNNFLNNSVENAELPRLAKVSIWLSSTSLFKEAWLLVTATPESWLVSQRVCFATMLWTIFLHKHRSRVKYTYAYMLIGQLVAISFATNLYFLALSKGTDLEHSVDTPSKKSTAVHKESSAGKGPTSTLLVQCVMISMTATLALSDAPDRLFLAVLLIIHVLLLIPLMVAENTTEPPASLAYIVAVSSTLYSLFIAMKCGGLHHVFKTMVSNPANGSISFDALMTLISVIIWNGEQRGWSVSHLFFTTLAPMWQPPIADIR